MRRVGWRALLAGVMGIGLASTARAGVPANRTDLTDIVNEMHADRLDSPLTGNRAFLELEGSTAFASGSVSAPGTGTTTTRVFWAAFEPDQTKRSDKGGSLQQKDELFVTIVLNGSTLFSDVLPGCKAKVQAKGPAGSSLIDEGDWSVSCNKKAVQATGISETDGAALQSALGKKVVDTSRLNIKGKCSDASCNELLPPS